jgi:hypothetical protein
MAWGGDRGGEGGGGLPSSSSQILGCERERHLSSKILGINGLPASSVAQGTLAPGEAKRAWRLCTRQLQIFFLPCRKSRLQPTCRPQRVVDSSNPNRDKPARPADHSNRCSPDLTPTSSRSNELGTAPTAAMAGKGLRGLSEAMRGLTLASQQSCKALPVRAIPATMLLLLPEL